MPALLRNFLLGFARITWLVLGLASLSAHAQSIFLKVAGIDGESTDARHVKEIEVQSWSWAVANAGTLTPAQWVDLTVQKRMDVATPGLMDAISRGKVLSNAVLTVMNPAGTEFYRIELQGVRATSLGLQVVDEAVETVTFSFEKLKVQYVPMAATGLPLPALGMHWNLLSNSGGLDSTNYVAASLIAVPGSRPQLSWATEPGKTYEVSVSENPWGPFVPLATYTAEQGSLSAPIVFDQPRRFYRVKEL